MRRLAALTAVAAASCSSQPSATLQIVTGSETDTFSRSPAPVTLKVEDADTSGNLTTLATASLPTSNVDLGSLDVNAIGTLEVTGLDANGTRLVFGSTVLLQFGALDGFTLPVFVQRTGECARMPGELTDSRPAPVLAPFVGRYLFVGGGSDPTTSSTTQLYDFATFSALSSPPSLPRVPASIAFVGTVAWLIDSRGATAFDFSSNTSQDVSAPSGGSFANVAGGATIEGTDGTQYVVGATRTSGAPTAAVLAIDTSGNMTWMALTKPRFGAAAAWVNGRGIAVAAGSGDAPGVEVLAIDPQTGAGSASALAYPPDPSIGASAATLDSQHVLLAGGTTPTGQDPVARSIDLGCGSGCTPTAWTHLPKTLLPASAFALDPASALVVGDDAAGDTHVVRLTTQAATEVPTKVPHTKARATRSPLGTVVLFGGASVIESFAP